MLVSLLTALRICVCECGCDFKSVSGFYEYKSVWMCDYDCLKACQCEFMRLCVRASGLNLCV